MKFTKCEVGERAVRLAFRLPDGRKVEHTFVEEDSTMVCYQCFALSVCIY